MWIFGQTPWTDVDQTFTIFTPLLIGRNVGCGRGDSIAALAWPPKKLPLLPLSTRRRLNTEYV